MTTTATLSLFGEIGTPDLNARTFRDALTLAGDIDELALQVHSEGGDIADGFSIYHQLLAHPARVVADVRSFAASMAGIVLMAADEIRMTENAFLVLHNPFYPVLGGESRDLRHAADLLDTFKASAIRAFRRHASLSEDELSALMDAETWLTADEAVAAGLAHAVTDRVEAVNRLDLSRFERVPPTARAFFLNPGGPDMSDKTDKKPTKTEEKTKTPEASPAPAEETAETLFARLGQMLLGRKMRETPVPAKTEAAVLTPEETAAVLAVERAALRADRARLHLDRDLGPHRDTVEPAALEKLEPVLLKLKTAELDGDADAAKQYASLTALLPALASTKAGGELAASDAASLKAALEISDARKAVDERRGITDERREALMTKFSGCRPSSVQEIR